MIKDPIVEEVREIRDEIARGYDYDIDAIVAAFQEKSKDSGRKTVSLPPKPPSKDSDRKAG